MQKSLPQNRITGAEALFGTDPTERIVAVEPDPQEGVWLYRRNAEGVTRERAPYKPWILLTEKPEIPLPGAQFTELEGEGYCVLAEFPNQAAYQEARFRVRDEHLSNMTYPGGGKMALLRSGQTLFKGMTFDDIVRLQFDIETDGLDPAPETNRVLLIAVSDNRGLLELLEGEEKEILEQFVRLVQERDPDVMEGHNIFGFDLPFLMVRSQKHGVRFSLGRDGSEVRQGQERNYAIGGNSRPFTPAYAHGRHFLDTYLVVQRFDWAKGSLTSYGLKECARQFGFAPPDRVELPRDQIARLYREEPDLVREYARQDAIETRLLAELITPVEFYQTQMVPDNYGQVTVTGNGEKINALFVRAYLAAGKAIARQQPSRPYAGGYSEVRLTGVLDNVVKADVESLYPSLMLTHRIAPAADTLGIFLPCLKDLTQRRLEAKRKAAGEVRVELHHPPAARDTETQREEAETPRISGEVMRPLTPDTGEIDTANGGVSPEVGGRGANSSIENRDYWDGLQNSFKVLINSFYGYLGGPFSWNDYAAAEKVTELGRELVQDVARRMVETHSQVIEIDTDGVYFVPPEGVQGEEAERAYIVTIGSSLPEGIRLAFDGRFARMLSLKTKNYVLVTHGGRKIFKGASLRSRADERYGRVFLTKAVDCLLEHKVEGVGELYAETIENLLHKRVPIEDLARRERVTEKTFQSEQKKRSAVVAEGVAVGEHLMVYEKKDGTLGLLENYQGDENSKYYMDKLYKFAKRLEEAFGDRFDSLIPKPTAQGLPKKVQETLDLFG